MSALRTVVFAIAGAVVATLVSFIPGSTVIGGAVSGFLEGPDARQATITGAVAGLIVFLPAVAIGIFVFAFLGFGFVAGGEVVFGMGVMFFVLLLGVAALVYTVGLAALGGYLGAILARDYPDEHASLLRRLGISSAQGTDRRESVTGPGVDDRHRRREEDRR